MHKRNQIILIPALNNIEMEDSAILECLRTGVREKEAFETLFRKYYTPMCIQAHRYLDMEDIEDVVQECFVWIWNNRSLIVVEKSVPSYMYSMVRHKALNTIRKRNIGQKVSEMLQEIRENDMDENAFDAEELKRRIQEAIESLPELYREAFTLHRFSDKTYSEIAEMYNVSPKTIDYRIQKSLKILRQKLSDYLPAALLAVVMEILENPWGGV